MTAFERAADRILDILFPKTSELLELEAAAKQDLRALLPRAKAPAHIEETSALFDYSDPRVKAMVWEIKYRRNKLLAHSVAQALAEELMEELSDKKLFDGLEHPVILPVPISKERRAERGFNQTELLSYILWNKHLMHLTTHIPNLLVKTRHTEPQTSLNREKRLSNLEGCFAVTNPILVQDRHVILIDDVVTTGATLTEARKTLLQAGARSVSAYVVAH